MKPMFEKVVTSPNQSWRYWLYELDNIEFNWHYHPEYEITLTLNSQGQRYVGDSIEPYDELDLALLGPYLPHTWNTAPTHIGAPHQVYIAQIPARWLEQQVQSLPELEPMHALLAKSRRGLLFSKSIAQKAAYYFRQMDKASPIQRYVNLLQVFALMLLDDQARTLSSMGYGLSNSTDSSADKLDKVINYLYQHYHQNIRADDMAAMVHMSTNHFHRFIKQRTEQTFTELVNQLRISKACSLLINTQQPIAVISDSCGFNNLSNFNRRFLQFKQATPSEFRKKYRYQSPSL